MTDAQPSTPTRMFLSRFSSSRPRYSTSQQRSLAWLAAAHAQAEAASRGLDAPAQGAFEARMHKLIERCACGSASIGERGHVLADVGRTDWREARIYDLERH